MMVAVPIVVVSFVTFVGLSLTGTSVAGFDKVFDVVTFGSSVKLEHIMSGVRLHSHDVMYGVRGGGSGQQSVTGMDSSSDSNSLWKILPSTRGAEASRTAVKCGSQIRLLHINTKKFLHSHRGFVSPLSHNQEVSALGPASNIDGGDDWVVECSGEKWLKESDVKLKHATTGYYLHHTNQHTFGRPIEGQKEICAFPHSTDYGKWRTKEGYFLGEEK
eukprot:m.41179 g.41179  ORF g.41179 m.41179 type:complete len:217 (-) comp6983_c1_seq1:175-825(-)